MTEHTDAAPTDGSPVDTEHTVAANRDQADAPLRSAATLAGAQPAEAPARQRSPDDIPLADGAVRDGGAYQGGRSPDASDGRPDESRDPLDSRDHFGGDGARFVDDGEAPRSSRRAGTAPDDDGYDPQAGRTARQEI